MAILIDQECYQTKAIKLFGTDKNQWVYVCPKCEREQDFWSFYGVPHMERNPHNTCAQGCEILEEDFEFTIMCDGADIPCFRFGQTIKYTGEFSKSLSSTSILKYQRQKVKTSQQSDYMLQSESRKTGVSFEKLVERRDKAIKKAKINNKKNYQKRIAVGREWAQIIKEGNKKRIVKAQKVERTIVPISESRVKATPLSAHMIRLTNQVGRRTIEEQIEAAKKSNSNN